MGYPVCSLCEPPGKVGPQRVRGPGALWLQERFQPEARLSDQQRRNPEGTKAHTEKWQRTLWRRKKLCSFIRGWARVTVQVQFTGKSCAHSHLPGFRQWRHPVGTLCSGNLPSVHISGAKGLLLPTGHCSCQGNPTGVNCMSTLASGFRASFQ